MQPVLQLAPREQWRRLLRHDLIRGARGDEFCDGTLPTVPSEELRHVPKWLSLLATFDTF